MKATIFCAVAILAVLCTPIRLSTDALATTGEGTLIQTVGRHTPFVGLDVEVFNLGDRFINYKITFGHRRTVGPPIAAVRKDLPWFFYAASPAEVWFYDGVESVLRIQFTKAATRFTDNHVVPDLLRDAPPTVRDHLPDRLRR